MTAKSVLLRPHGLRTRARAPLATVIFKNYLLVAIYISLVTNKTVTSHSSAF